jgi:predicted SAM-dependent methyltransferase
VVPAVIEETYWMRPSYRGLQRILYGIPVLGRLAEYLVVLATIAKKLRIQNERIERLESANSILIARIEKLEQGIDYPAMMNFIASFASTSRELARSIETVGNRVDALSASMDGRVDALSASMDGRVDALSASMDGRVDALSGQVHSASEQDRQLRDELASLQLLTRNICTDFSRSVQDLWQRLEFVRRETLFEVQYSSGKAAGRDRTQAVSRVLNPRKLALMGEGLKVNVGCGHRPMDGYINVDRRELLDIDVVSDADNLPFGRASVEEIFSSHLIEHFPREELVRTVLPHWFGVLRKGGTLRAVVPDFETMATRYIAGDYPFEKFRTVIFGAQDYDGDFHYDAFSREDLARLLEEAGFKDVSFPVVGRPNGDCFEMEVTATK